jgi:hypothetical protein
MNVRDLLVDQSDDVFGRTWRRLVGLTDAELVWEPAPHCWSVRERADGSVRADWAPYIGDGETTGSGYLRKTRTGGDPRQPPPFTNLAWRLWHLTGVYASTHHARALLGDTVDRAAPPPRHTASAALDELDAAHARWREVLTGLTDEQLEEPAAGSRDALRPKVGYVMYMIDEFTHHGAEIGVLRDLYAHVQRSDPLAASPNLAELAWAGMWHLLPAIIDRCSDPDAESRGVRALHLAAAAGERDIVERLLACGADPRLTCPLPVVWGGAPSPRWPGETPAQWAEHFGHGDLGELLRGDLD